MLPKAAKQRYTAELANDISKRLTSLKKVIKCVRRVVSEDTTLNKAELPKLIDTVESEDQKIAEIMMWAHAFKLKSPVKGNKRWARGPKA